MRLYGTTIVDDYDGMNVVGHYHIYRHIDMGEMAMHLIHALRCNLPHFRQTHHAIRNFTQIMLPIVRAYCYKIRTAIVIVPCGTGRWDTIAIFKADVAHIIR